MDTPVSGGTHPTSPPPPSPSPSSADDRLGHTTSSGEAQGTQLLQLLLHLSDQLREQASLTRQLLGHLEAPSQEVEPTPDREYRWRRRWELLWRTTDGRVAPASTVAAFIQALSPSHGQPPTAPPGIGATVGVQPLPSPPRRLDQRDVIQQTREGVVNLGQEQQASSLRAAAQDLAAHRASKYRRQGR